MTMDAAVGLGSEQLPFQWGHWTGRRGQEHRQATLKEEVQGLSVQFHCEEQYSIDMVVFFF